jgi:hypothetical protein
MKYLVVLLLLAYGVFGAYNTTKAKSMGFICASTFGTEAEINSWTCKYCSYNNVTNVNVLSSSPKPSITLSSIFSVSLDICPLKMLLLLPLEALSLSKIGSSILMPLK